MSDLAKVHRLTKATRQRGSLTASALASELYLRRMEDECEILARELMHVRRLLQQARRAPNVVAMDQAQQRMHRVVRKLGRIKKK